MRASAWLVGLFLFPLASIAQEEAPPPMELLAFIGEWEVADTGWVDQALSGEMMRVVEAEANEQSNDDE